MKNVIRVSAGLLMVAVIYSFSACSRQKFASANNCGTGCVGLNQQGFGEYDYSYTTASNKTDLLFVDDNSASMYVLQQNLGSKFPTLFNTLASKDYHIGIINTDVVDTDNPARSTLDGYPYTQNGALISFPDGSPFLTSNSANPEQQFDQTIARPETLACQNWIAANCDPFQGCTDPTAYRNACPSDDTRAIFAADLAIRNNPSGFIRDSSVPLNIVILSNADERASGGVVSQYPIETQDQPSNLLSDLSSQYPGKQVKIHSIVIPPGDQTCYNQQHISNTIFGWYGVIYDQAASLTGGVVSTASNDGVCASDYSGILSNIAMSLTNDDGSRELSCIPDNTFKPTLPAGLTNSFTVTPNPDGTAKLSFQPALPPGTTVQLHINCTD